MASSFRWVISSFSPSRWSATEPLRRREVVLARPRLGHVIAEMRPLLQLT